MTEPEREVPLLRAALAIKASKSPSNGNSLLRVLRRSVNARAGMFGVGVVGLLDKFRDALHGSRPRSGVG